LGKFNGLYECFEHTFHVSLELFQSGDKLSGALLISDQAVPPGTRRPTNPVKISGKVDFFGGLTFETREKVYIDRGVHERLRFRGARNRTNGYLVGDMWRDGCSFFVVAPNGREEEVLDFVRRRVKASTGQAGIERDYEVRIRAGYVPIELRPAGGVLLSPQPYLQYADRAYGTETEKRRQMVTLTGVLQRQGLACAMGSNVVWKGDSGSAPAVAFGATHFLIACLSNCDGLRYGASGAQGEQRHFGMLHQFPVVALNLAHPERFPDHDFEWQFKKTVPGTPDPRIVVTSWQAPVLAFLSRRKSCDGTLGK
jgi:hypothetical protein